MNVRNIRKIKQNLQILQNQNDLQESKILGLANYLNLTMIQVQEYQEFFVSSMSNCWYLITLLLRPWKLWITLCDNSSYWYSYNSNQTNLMYV